ncbi:MAG: Hpt domain-containing protein [Pseudomonadota bacterium]|nr:Hpt domain-containing protein [Pseudomonadota bacterium]
MTGEITMMGTSGYDEKMQTAILAVRGRFVGSLAGRLEAMDRIMLQLEAGLVSDDALTHVAADAHKIRGLAKTLGFAELGELAGNVENAVNAFLAKADAAPARAELFAMIDALLDQMDQVQSGD